VLSALAPALQSVSTDLTVALKSGARAGWPRSRLRDALVVAQAALSVVLLVGAVLFIRSLRNVKAHDVGYTVNRVAFASVQYDTKDSARDAEMPARLHALEPRIAAIPGVERVAFTSMRPKWGFTWTDYYPDIDTTGLHKPAGLNWAVSPDYFAAIGTRLIRGRTFSAGPIAAKELIVDEAMADALWPHQDPIGHCVRFKSHLEPCITVIGLVQTTLFASITEKPSPHFYISVDHPAFRTFGLREIVVRASPERLPAVQKSLGELLRGEFLGGVPELTTMSGVMEPEYRPWQLGATLFSLFGALALLVAGIGIYSTVSYAVGQRTHEFGVRIALGAQSRDLLGQVVGEGLRPVVLGIAAGITLSLAAGRFVASLLYDVKATDPTTMAIVAVVLLLIAAISAMVPARRAAQAEPISALRAE
jgi:predicted permease